MTQVTKTKTGNPLLRITISNFDTDEVLEWVVTDETVSDVLAALGRRLSTWDSDSDYADYLEEVR